MTEILEGERRPAALGQQMSSTGTAEPAGSGPSRAGARRWFSLGRLAPAILLAWLALDFGLRLLPVERLGVSPLTAAQRFTGRHSPFVANASMSEPADTPGENAVRANLAPTERRDAPLRFSTNAFGYRRNPEAAPGDGADVLILGGDSFIYGASLSDEETLPAALTRASGLQAFNGGRSHLIPMNLADLDWLLQHLPRRPREAVFVHLEQHRRSLPEDGPGHSDGLLDDFRYARWLASGYLDVSPLGHATRRLFRRFADGKILPNAYQRNVDAYTLPDGQAMLFRDFETLPARRPQNSAATRRTAEYIVEWVRELRARGLETHVLLLPSRFTVYAPWLREDAHRAGAVAAAQDLTDLEAQLNGEDIRTINGLTVFQSTAASDLEARRLPFYREDNHWNADGVERIARVLADSLTPPEPPVRTEPMAGLTPAMNR